MSAIDAGAVPEESEVKTGVWRWRLRPLCIVAVIAVAAGGICANRATASGEAQPNTDAHRDQGYQYDRWGRVVYSPDEGRVTYAKPVAGEDVEAAAEAAVPEEVKRLLERLSVAGSDAFERRAVKSGESPLDNAWSLRSVYGERIGASRLAVGDMDDDGVVEIVAGASSLAFGPNDHVYAVEYHADGGYRISWLSPVLGRVEAVAVFDSDGDGVGEIYVGLWGGEVVVFDGSTHEQIAYLETGSGPLSRILLGDGDNDGQDEIIVCGSSRTYLFDGASRSPEVIIGQGGADVALGNVDSDPELELVFAGGVIVEVAAGGVQQRRRSVPGAEFMAKLPWSEKEEWVQEGVAGDRVGLVQIDGDSELEIVAVSSDGTAVYDRASYGEWQLVWQEETPAEALAVADVTGDGVAEIVVGGAQWGEIRCYDAATQQAIWTQDNPRHGVSDLVVADVDRDGAVEVIWGTGHSSTEADALVVSAPGAATPDWQSSHADGGPFAAVDVGDADGDGELEIVFASFEAAGGFGDGIIHVFDAGRHDEEFSSVMTAFGSTSWSGIRDVAIGDVDDDTQAEIVVGTSQYHDGAIHVFGPGTAGYELEASHVYPRLQGGSPVYALVVADVDQDSSTEIVAGGSVEGVESGGARVHVIDGASGVVEWSTEALGATWTDVKQVAVGNTDADQAFEIVAVADQVYVFDGASHAKEWQSAGGGYESIGLFDVTGDGVLDILAGTSEGEVVGFTAAIGGYDEVWPSDPVEVAVGDGDPVVAVRGYRTAASELRLAIACAGVVAGVDPATEAVVWQSEAIGVTGPNSLEVADITTQTGTMFLAGGLYSVIQFGGVEPPSAVAFSTRRWSVDEDSSLVDLVVTRGGGSTGLVSVDYATADGSAAAPGDYQSQSGSLNWGDGDATERTITVLIADDDVFEPSQSFGLLLDNLVADHGYLAAPFEAEVTIVDDDTAHFQFSASSYQADEDAGPVTVVVSRTGGLHFATQVDYATTSAGGTAEADDYVGVAGTCLFAVDQSQCPVDITLNADVDDEGDETFQVSLSDPGWGADLGSPGTAVVTIVNDDHVELSLDSPSYAVWEEEGPFQFVIERVGSPNRAVSVDYSLTNGTAAGSAQDCSSGGDFVLVSGTAQWADSDTADKPVSVQICDDSDATGADEYFNISLSNPTNQAVLGDNPSATVTILDEDRRQVAFAEDTYSVDEEAGQVVISVQRAGLSTGAITVDYATADGAAEAGSDYVAASGQLSWASGETTAKSVTIQILDDAVFDGHKGFSVELSSPYHCVVAEPSTTTVTVLDSEWREFPVNTNTTDNQRAPQVAMDAAGNFVVVWQSDQDTGTGEDWEIYARRFASDGTPIDATEFRVNSSGTAGSHIEPAVAMTATGEFLVTWCSLDGTNRAIYARGYMSNGTPYAPERLIASDGTGDQVLGEPVVAYDDSGIGMVAWTSIGTLHDVTVRRVSVDGSPYSTAKTVNTTTAGNQDHPSITPYPGPDSANPYFMVAWECDHSSCDGSGEGVYYVTVDKNGDQVTNEAAAYPVLSNDSDNDQMAPSICADSNGNRDIVWQSDMDPQDGFDIYRGIDASVNQLVSVPNDGDQTNPAVSRTSTGISVVVWESASHDGSGLGVFTRRWNGYTVDGVFQANSFTTGDQYQPDVALADTGAYVVVWTSSGQDGSGDGIFAAWRAAGVKSGACSAPARTGPMQRTGEQVDE